MTRPSVETGVAVVTIVAGRHDHLAAQLASLADGDAVPEHLVVVAMGDPAVQGVVDASPLAGRSRVVPVDVDAGARLPLARARNAGADVATSLGCGLLVFLDVDCLAAPTLVRAYAGAARTLAERGAAGVLSGAVAYLPPKAPGRSAYDAATIAASAPHPARPAPPAGVLEAAPDTRLFWSLSFAVTPGDWHDLGGFDEGYTGYGGEDTDFGQRLAAADGRLWWVGGALAHHQWHPVSDPPTEHLDDIVRNANRFHRRWGWFPMEGWLGAFQERGLAHHDPDQDRWVVSPPRPAGRMAAAPAG